METDLGLSRTATDYNDLLGQLLLLHSDGLLHGDLVKRVHGVFDSFSDHTGLIWLDSDLDSIVDHPLTTNKNSEGHGVSSEILSCWVKKETLKLMMSVLLLKVR